MLLSTSAAIMQGKTSARKLNLGLKFEYTSAGTPQENGKVERNFATLYGGVRSALNRERLTKDIRQGVWNECVNTMTKLDNLLMTASRAAVPFKKLAKSLENSETSEKSESFSFMRRS